MKLVHNLLGLLKGLLCTLDITFIGAIGNLFKFASQLYDGGFVGPSPFTKKFLVQPIKR